MEKDFSINVLIKNSQNLKGRSLETSLSEYLPETRRKKFLSLDFNKRNKFFLI